MDAGELLTLAPGTGLGGLVTGLFVWTLRVSREDRAEYRAALKAAAQDARTDLDGQRARAAQDREQAAADRLTLEAEIGDLRRRLADAQQVAEIERGRRRAAEETTDRREV